MVSLLNPLLELLLVMTWLTGGSEGHTGVCLQNEIFFHDLVHFLTTSNGIKKKSRTSSLRNLAHAMNL